MIWQQRIRLSALFACTSLRSFGAALGRQLRAESTFIAADDLPSLPKRIEDKVSGVPLRSGNDPSKNHGFLRTPHGGIASKNSSSQEHHSVLGMTSTISLTDSSREFQGSSSSFLPSEQSGRRRLDVFYSCTFTTDDDDENVVLSFSGERGSSENLIVNGQWFDTVTGIDTYIASGAAGSTVVVRLRGSDYSNTETGYTDVACTAASKYSCTYTTDGSDALLTFGGVRGDNEQLRINGIWEATVTGLDSYRAIGAAIDAVMLVRVRGEGFNNPEYTDVQCKAAAPTAFPTLAPSILPPPPPPPPILDFVCTYTAEGNDALITFGGRRGSNENLRVDGVWVETVSGFLMYRAMDAAASTIVVRVRGEGYDNPEFTDVTCTAEPSGESPTTLPTSAPTPAPTPPPTVVPATVYTCVFDVVNGNDVVLNFSGPRGDSENLRVDDVWLMTVTGLTTVTAEDAADSSIVVRLRGPGYSNDDPNSYTEVECAEGGNEPPEGPWELVWEDEFTGNSLDETKWKIYVQSEFDENGYGNPYRIQKYTESNIEVTGGNLVIHATHDAAIDQYYSGMLFTNDNRIPPKNSYTGNLGWTYGKFDIRAKLPHGYGQWPAIWMRPIEYRYEGPDGSFGWPVNGEIDIMEYIGPGRDPSRPNSPVNRLVQNIHFLNSKEKNQQAKNTFPIDQTSVEEFHVYGLEWEANEMRFYFNGDLVHEVSNWESYGGSPTPFDQPFDLILQVQIGGWAGPPDPADYPAQMVVDWVRVYEKVI